MKNETPLNIEYRMRGKNHWHHRLEKPSLEIKTKKRKSLQNDASYKSCFS